jgi:hypothetical protein
MSPSRRTTEPRDPRATLPGGGQPLPAPSRRVVVTGVEG